MNTVTIHPQPRKPLTFADIKAGPFVWDGQPCTKLRYELHSTVADGVNATRFDGEALRMSPTTIVTLPDAPPEDDTVSYRDLKGGELFEMQLQFPSGWVAFQLEKEADSEGERWCIRLKDGERDWWIGSTRVRRVHSVTITREKEGPK